MPRRDTIELGLRQNAGQVFLLVIVNAFVGAMVGLERAILPAIAEHEFHLAARAAVLFFIVVFGIVKALTNYAAGRFSDRLGRKTVLVAGWLIAVPVPFLLMWAPSWNWVLLTNVLFNTTISDMEVGYKAFRGELIRSIELVSDDFRFEPEVTAKVLRIPGIRLYEVPISYYGRTFAEGKKITWRDGLKAVGALVRFRFSC